MKIGLSALLLLAPLAACNRQPAASEPPRVLRPAEKIVRAVLGVIASDGKPVCVQRNTYGRPLNTYRIARQGQLQHVYTLGWYSPQPLRPPTMPTIGELRRDVQDRRNADMPEPPARTDDLPKAEWAALDASAMALSQQEEVVNRVAIRADWAPRNVFPRLWPAKNEARGCTAQYNISNVAFDQHYGFVTMRADHWGTIYAVERAGDDWKPTGQWGYWLY